MWSDFLLASFILMLHFCVMFSMTEHFLNEVNWPTQTHFGAFQKWLREHSVVSVPRFDHYPYIT